MNKVGIDVSEHNGVIDWESVKPNIHFAIIRCGFGDDIESQDDEQFRRNADECTRLGIPFGLYLCSYATSPAQAQSEARHALRLAKDYKLSLPIYFDTEIGGTESTAAANAVIFCNMVEKAGYWAGIYAGLYWWRDYLTGLGNRYTKWIAQYYTECTLGEPVDVWQHTDSGRLPGIGGNVDMNIMYGDLMERIASKKEVFDAEKQKALARTLEEIYVTELGRLPDPEGLKAWTEVLYKEQLTAEQVRHEIVNSREGCERFVRELYKFLLEREPDAVGLANWVNTLMAGKMTRAEMYKEFLNSEEYKRLS